MIINVVQNAIESMRGMGKLTVKTTLSQDNARAVVIISDTGAGIPQDVLPKIFTPFFTTKPIGKGTGLGLAIAYGIVKMHRGNIYAKSETGKGTSVIIEIPFGLGKPDILYSENV